MPVQYNLLQRGFKNVSENGQIIGFQVKIKAAYYRGVVLSLIEGVDLTVDGESYTPDQMRFTIGNRAYSFAEMANITNVWWPWLEPATLTVRKPGGLKPAVHDVQAVVKLRISYMPFNPMVYAFQDKLVLMG
jgi:hypothetical protein